MDDPDDELLIHRQRSASNTTVSDVDEANDIGCLAATHENRSTSRDIPISTTHISIVDERELQLKRWDLNYHEAAIFLQEGKDNEKFTSHPRSQSALPVYLITHSVWFNIVDLAAALLLMSLALIEQPSIPLFSVPIWVHGFLELFGLCVLAVELCLRMKWLGPKYYVRHVRTMIKSVTLSIMFVEAVVVLVRQTNHFRVTRALRPLFVLDSDFCRGVRRFIRQVIQSMPPILDMLLLLLFFMMLFSILGFYIFSNVPNDSYFGTIQDSFINLFILLTTANFPDVMMPAYNYSRWAALFFIIYLCLELYLLMNLFLAVVTAAFTKVEKLKLKKLLLHKRCAAQYSFKLLVSKQNPDMVILRHFQGVMQYLVPKAKRLDVYLTFKALNKSKSGVLSLEEYYGIYDLITLSWKKRKAHLLWSSGFRKPFDKLFIGFHWFVTWKWFNYFIYVVIFANMLLVVVDTIMISVQRSTPGSTEWIKDEERYLLMSLGFVIIYAIEAILKILGLGPRTYFSSGWNVFDFVVTVTALIGVLPAISKNLYYVVIVRPLRVLRLFKLRRSFRDVFGTLFILFHRLISLGLSMVLLFYCFGVVGMELFSKHDLRNCCVNSSVEDQYRYDNETGTGGYYYLNNFENILISGVTLFELTVVNNWYIIMEGYAVTISEWTRIYFMLFYLVTMTVLTIVVALILEAFLFRIEYRNKMHGQDMIDHAIKKVDVELSFEEIDMCTGKLTPLLSKFIIEQTSDTDPRSQNHTSTYRGEKVRSKDDFSYKMYSEEVEDWIAEEENERTSLQDTIEASPETLSENELRQRSVPV